MKLFRRLPSKLHRHLLLLSMIQGIDYMNLFEIKVHVVKCLALTCFFSYFSSFSEGMPTLVEAPKRNLPPPPSSPKSTSGYVSKFFLFREDK